MNVNKLKGKIVEKGLTIGKLASIIGINRSTLYRKLNNSTLTVKEVNLIVKALELSRDDAIDIFFTNKVA